MSALILLLNRHDERMLHALVLRRRGVTDLLMRWITHLGDAVVAIAIVLALLLSGVPGLEHASASAAFALVISHLWVQLLKRTITRPRPRLPVGYHSLVEAPDRFSFPSGHAAASLSIALPVAAALPPPFAAALLALGGMVGLSRCYLGVHYPGDVVTGWLLAAAATWLSVPVLAGVLG